MNIIIAWVPVLNGAEYMSHLSSIDETCQFWVNFILEDCLPYIGLFVSLRRFVQPFYTQGAKEVHVIFDQQYSDFNLKQWEQSKRDNAAKVSKQEPHNHIPTINSTTQVPSNWRALLGCRTCKQQLQTATTCIPNREYAQLCSKLHEES